MPRCAVLNCTAGLYSTNLNSYRCPPLELYFHCRMECDNFHEYYTVDKSSNMCIIYYTTCVEWMDTYGDKIERFGTFSDENALGGK